MSEEICLICGKLQTPWKSYSSNREGIYHICRSCSTQNESTVIVTLAIRITDLEKTISGLTSRDTCCHPQEES